MIKMSEPEWLCLGCGTQWPRESLGEGDACPGCGKDAVPTEGEGYSVGLVHLSVYWPDDDDYSE